MNSTNVKHYLPFIVFLSLLISRLPLSGNVATSVVPGWHATIFPPYFILVTIATICLLFTTIGYWKLAKKDSKMNSIFLIAHLLLTLPATIFSTPNVILTILYAKNTDEHISHFLMAEQLMFAFYALFFIGQILFAGYLLKRIYFKRKSQV